MSDAGYPGWQDAFGQNNPMNAISFMIRQMMAQASHVALVVVKNVTPNDNPLIPPTVDVQPMVHQVDQKGNAQEHGTIYKISVFRPQGGNSAFICDPVTGDIGVVICADRDISSAVANQAPSNPGSFRRFDWADSLYIGGFGLIEPTTYVKIDDTDGITIQVKSGNTLTINADTINIAASDGSSDTDAELTGTLTASVDVVGDSVSLHDHVHSDVQSGPDDTGPPT